MGTERQMLIEDFEMWLKTRFTDMVWLKGHKFEKTKTGEILIDKGKFTQEEARQLFMFITSRNPFQRFNATLLIWERSGVLIKVLIALAILVLVLVYIRVKR